LYVKYYRKNILILGIRDRFKIKIYWTLRNKKTMDQTKMRVKKRDGTLVPVRLDEITDRIASLSKDLDQKVIDPVKITLEVVEKIHDGISTSLIDSFTAEICHTKAIEHPHFNILASRLVIGDHQKTIQVTANLKFSEVCKLLYTNTDQLGEPSPLISDELYSMSQGDKDIIDNMVNNERDFLLDYFGFKTLTKNYLLKVAGKVVETPQHMFMRVALGIHGKFKLPANNLTERLNKIVQELKDKNIPEEQIKDLSIKLLELATGRTSEFKLEEGKLYEADYDLVKETYDLLSMKYFTHATPTLYNAGTRWPQFFSCFLQGMGDSLTSQNNNTQGSIYTTLEKVAEISKRSGGIGIHVHEIRGNGSYIRGTGGKGDGLVPMLRVYNDTARYVNQGGRRSGSFAIYLEPWHADIRDFVKMGLKHGDQNRRAPDLFYALWIPDLFMERVKNNETWSLMCPSECPGLANVYGKDFKKLYERYEKEGRVVDTINAQDLWHEIIKSQIETGTPYMTYKDAANYKSNQKNVGTIRSSNLCSEIMEYSDTEKYACCVLASLVLPTYVVPVPVKETKKKTKEHKEAEHEPELMFDHEKLAEVVKVVTRNLNKLIDLNYYPVEETRRSNMSERPIGIGIQGLADVFFKLGLPYDSDEALKLDREIMETIYFAALSSSMELSKIHGPYATFKGSPISKGLFQFDLWKEFPTNKEQVPEIIHSGRYDWDKLKREIKKHGVRNSLVTALMPTATTSQIMGSASESFEPITSNCYTRRVKAGEFLLINPYMAADLVKAGLWNDDMRQKLLTTRGSLQNIPEIPQKLKDVYKTVWELQQKVLIDHSIARAPYVDQSQSLNLYFADGNQDKITKAHFYGWSRGLKTGSYYIRTKPAINAASFTMDSKEEKRTEEVHVQQRSPPKKTPMVDADKDKDNNDEACESCGA
jgi:ribonucleoside-diphosphate reductase alpha chain